MRGSIVAVRREEWTRDSLCCRRLCSPDRLRAGHSADAGHCAHAHLPAASLRRIAARPVRDANRTRPAGQSQRPPAAGRRDERGEMDEGSCIGPIQRHKSRPQQSEPNHGVRPSERPQHGGKLCRHVAVCRRADGTGRGCRFRSGRHRLVQPRARRGNFALPRERDLRGRVRAARQPARRGRAAQPHGQIIGKGSPDGHA
jgi:hypothetical protein